MRDWNWFCCSKQQENRLFMKQLFVIAPFFFIFLISEAQIPGDIRLQLGADYALAREHVGINFGVEYFLSDQFSLAPNYTRYLPDAGKASTLNFDVRYYLAKNALQWYGLAGITNHWSSSPPFGPDDQHYNTGANLGLGGVLKCTDWLAFNSEFKYQIHSRGQAVFRLGFVFILVN